MVGFHNASVPFQALHASRIASAARREAAAAASASAISRVDERGLSAADRDALQALEHAEWVEEEILAGLLNHLKESLGASGAYLARYDEQAAQREGETLPGLRYVAADQGHDYMLGNCLLEV